MTFSQYADYVRALIAEHGRERAGIIDCARRTVWRG